MASDVQAIEQALAEEDMREAFRVIDGQAKLASEEKARTCLPRLFPRARSQPQIPISEPAPEDVERFLSELSKAYQHAPKNRGAGPGGSRGEHWKWMPMFEPSWQSFAQVAMKIQLGLVEEEVVKAMLSARILAGDRPEGDKVRPFALGNFH